MNVFRSLARNLWSVFETPGVAKPEAGAKTLNAVREERRVPPVLGLSRFRDGFEQFPQATGAQRMPAERTFRPTTQAALQRDGFDAGPRRPVDLSGGTTRPATRPSSDARAAPAWAFAATLDELAALI